MSERMLAAGAVAKGDTVRILDETPVGPSSMDVTIERVEPGVPEAGKTTWHVQGGLKVVIGAATRVEVIALRKGR